MNDLIKQKLVLNNINSDNNHSQVTVNSTPATSTAIKPVSLIHSKSTSNCLFDFNNILLQPVLDGVIIVNLNDILPTGFLPAYFRNGDVGTDIIHTIHILQQIFYKIKSTKLAVICYLDVRAVFNPSIPDPVNKIRLKCEAMLTSIYSGVYSGPGLADVSIGTLIVYEYNMMLLQGVDFKKYIHTFVTNGVKYLPSGIADNYWLVGNTPAVDYNNIVDNTNFMAIIVHGFKMISVTGLIANETCFTLPSLTNKLQQDTSATYQPEIYASPYMKDCIIMKKLLSNHKTEVLRRMTDYRDKIREQIESVLDTGILTGNVSQIIYLNLDPVFDHFLLDGVKSAWSTYKINSNRNKNTKTVSTNTSASTNPFESLFSVLSMDAVKPTSGCSNDVITTDIILISNNMNGKFEVPTGKSPGNNIFYIMLNNNLCGIKDEVFRPDFVSSLKHVAINSKSINVIVGRGLTPAKCNIITNYLLTNNNSKYKIPEKMQVKLVEFDINPGMRINLGYMYYSIPYLQANIMATYTSQSDSSKTHIETNRLYNNFTKWVKWVKQLDTKTHNNKLSEIAQCCECCKCMATKGLNVFRLGHLPYLDIDVVKKLSKIDALWIPMA